VISLDFFSDLRGKMKSFLKEFDPEIQKYAKEMIEKSFKVMFLLIMDTLNAFQV